MSPRVPTRKRKPARAPLVPHGAKKTARRVEYLGGASFALFLMLIIGAFSGAGLARYAMRLPQVAAVVSATLVDLANADRAQAGLPSLTADPALTAAAQAKAEDMAAKGYFAHVSPEGVDPWHWFAQARYAFDYAGENLAVDFSESADVERAWMQSPAHRENILNPRFTEVGIATAQGMYQGRLVTFVVQEFGMPSSRGRQEPLASASVPEASEKLALASAQGSERVLGSVAHEPRQPASARKEAQAQPAGKHLAEALALPAVAPAMPQPASPAALAQEGWQAGTAQSRAPLWAVPLAFPRQTLRIVYYAIAVLVLAALALETGREIRWHHRRHAIRAGMLLGLMAALFLAADAWFFAQPVLAALAV